MTLSDFFINYFLFISLITWQGFPTAPKQFIEFVICYEFLSAFDVP